jgi:glucuronokinase
MDKVGYGIYTIMDINLLPPLHLIYAENPSDSGKVRELFTTLLLILLLSFSLSIVYV